LDGVSRRRQNQPAMSVYLVTGVSGSGKSTLAQALNDRGIAAIDTDEDQELARFVDAAGAVVRRPDEPDREWLAAHHWAWNPARLDELLAAHRDETLFLCGNADNATDFGDRYAQVFLLAVDEVTMLRRLADPSRTNDYGLVGDTGELVKRWRPGFQRRLLAVGAIPIDANAPLPTVIDSLLGHIY
ncbi:AAA family ATPase, partial [Fodinicola feengrottensis]